MLLALAVVLGSSGALLAGFAVFASGSRPPAYTVRSAPAPRAPAALKPHPRVVVALAPGAPAPAGAPAASAPQSERAPTPPTDSQIKHELAMFRQQLATTATITGKPGTILPDGAAVVPPGVPALVAAIIKAGNAIATKPYIWGGGHGGWADSGYDCSGSVSFALAGAGLLSAPMASTGFENWGDPGPGRWVTIYANAGHVYMIVAGLRFDTAGQNAGTRWQHGPDPVRAPFAVRHPPGL